MADLDAGATGSMSSALLPELIKLVIEGIAAAGATKRRRNTREFCR